MLMEDILATDTVSGIGYLLIHLLSKFGVYCCCFDKVIDDLKCLSIYIHFTNLWVHALIRMKIGWLGSCCHGVGVFYKLYGRRLKNRGNSNRNRNKIPLKLIL